MNQPLISVIVPCYKVELYLPKCVDSILHQSYENLEIWLVDDGSPDKCGQLCDEYAKKDKRIRVIHKPNGGLSDARNVAIDQARGEWITFVDSDDFVSENYVETLYLLARKYDSEASVACFKIVREGEQPQVCVGSFYEEKMDATNAVEEMFYQEKFDNSAWGKLYHRKLFETGIRYPKGLVFEDLPTTYRLLFACKHVAYVNKVIYFYLIRSSSIEGVYSPKKIDNAMEVIRMMEGDEKLLKRVEKAFRCRKFSFLLHLLLPLPKDVEHYQEIKNLVMSNRKDVLFDKRARKKARIAALLSYLGIDFVKFVFSFVNNRE